MFVYIYIYIHTHIHTCSYLRTRFIRVKGALVFEIIDHSLDIMPDMMLGGVGGLLGVTRTTHAAEDPRSSRRDDTTPG